VRVYCLPLEKLAGPVSETCSFVTTDHPLLLLQHMIWREGDHHGQIKLTLKLSGWPITDDQAGPVTWRI